MRKNYFVLTALIISMLGIAGCAAKSEAAKSEAAKSEAAKSETAKSEAEAEETVIEESINIRMEQKKEEYKAEDGTLLLTCSETIPAVEISGNEEAAATINEYIKNYNETDNSPDVEILEWAEEDYKLRGKDNWYEGYVTDRSFTGERTDEAVISFLINSYSYTGGAHPNSVQAGLNFDTKTGRRLTLADIAIDENAARDKITEYILAEVRKREAEEEGMFFEDYEENIGDILSEDTWYLAENGMHIIGNEYIISPHAAGILDFVIPYEKADFLKEEYK